MRRLHIPAMKREILYIIVKPATIGGKVKDDVFHPTADELEDEKTVKGCLMSPWTDNTGFHLLVSPQGQVWPDIIMQRNGEASPGYNADGILIGCIALRGEDGKYCQQVRPQQHLVAKALVRTLKSVFPKATFKMGNSYAMNCKAEDIYDNKKDEEEEV